MMRRFVLMLLLCSASFSRAQNQPLLYDFTEIPQSLLLNPGVKVGYSWYAGIPTVSGIFIQARSNALTYNDLFAADGLNFYQKVSQNALNRLTPNDEVGASFQIDLLNGGFRSRKHPGNFYSFGMYLQHDLQVYWPSDIVELGWDGSASQLDRRFNLGHLNLQGYLRNVIHFGLNRALSNRLTAGARIKIYNGIFNFISTRNAGYFSTSLDALGFLTQNTLNANMRLQTTGLEGYRKLISANPNDVGSVVGRETIRRGLLGGDLGLGLDLGFTYDISSQLYVTGSLLDWGIMSNSSEVRNVELRGQNTVVATPVQQEALLSPDDEFWQALADEINDIVPFVENQEGYLTFNPMKLYGSIRYNFGAPPSTKNEADCDCSYRHLKGRNSAARSPFRNGLGAQLYLINRPSGPQSAFSIFFQRQLTGAIGLKTTYSADKFSKTNIGLGLNVQAGPVEMYVLADNLLGYSNLANSHLASFQIGLNILSWPSNP